MIQRRVGGVLNYLNQFKFFFSIESLRWLTFPRSHGLVPSCHNRMCGTMYKVLLRFFIREANCLIRRITVGHESEIISQTADHIW